MATPSTLKNTMSPLGRDRGNTIQSVFGPLQRGLVPTDLSPTEDFGVPASLIGTNRTAKSGASLHTTTTCMPEFEVDFEANDPEDPLNWPLWYRGMTIGFMSFATWTVVLASTSYTSGMPQMMRDLGIDNEIVATTGMTAYLLGLAVGSLLLAPISEIWGRRTVYLWSMVFFAVMTIPCALAQNLQTLIVCRFLGACAGAAMIANAPGTLSDISDEQHRALALSIWSIGPLNGPITGPLIGGFASQYLGWRWTNWIVLLFAVISWVMLATISETYTPCILKAKAARLRKRHNDPRYWCRYDERKKLRHILRANLSRPFILVATEPILMFWDLYASLIYGILYLGFVAYPYIFTHIRGWSTGISGLAFAGIGMGCCIVIACEPLIRRMINAHAKDPETGEVPPEASVSIICIGAILVPIGELIFAWTSLPARIHWIVSILAGIPFGAGNTIIFVYASNYIAGTYGIYAASALAGNSVLRSIVGGTLPLVGTTMMKNLTPQWAGTVLGALEVLFIPVPFVFYKWGHQIRQRSPLIRRMREDKERRDGNKAAAAERKRRLARASGTEGLEGPGDAEKGPGLTV